MIFANENTYMIKLPLSINSRNKKSKIVFSTAALIRVIEAGDIIVFKESPFLMHLYVWYSVTFLPFFFNLHCIVRLRVVPIFP